MITILVVSLVVLCVCWGVADRWRKHRGRPPAGYRYVQHDDPPEDR